MDDVLLRHIAEGVRDVAGVDVLAIDEHRAARGEVEAGERVEERRFPRAARAEDAGELRRRDGESEVVEQREGADGLAQADRADGGAARGGDAHERFAVVLQPERPDLQPVADGELVHVEAVAVHERAGGRVEVGDDTAAVLQSADAGVAAGDAGIVQHHVGAGVAADGELAAEVDAIRRLAADEHRRDDGLGRRAVGRGGLGRGAEAEHDDRGADADFIARPQLDGRGDDGAVHAGAADAAEVFQEADAAVPLEAAVVARDFDVGERERGVRRAAGDEGAGREREDFRRQAADDGEVG